MIWPPNEMKRNELQQKKTLFEIISNDIDTTTTKTTTQENYY